MNRRLLRGLALLIVVAGIVDPAIRRRMVQRPTVSIVMADSFADRDLVNRLEAKLRSTADLVRGSFPAADAVVVVGRSLPQSVRELGMPTFALMPARHSGTWLERVVAPAIAPIDATVPIYVRVRVPVERTAKLVATLSSGNLVLDRVDVDLGTGAAARESAPAAAQEVRRDDANGRLIPLTLSYVPAVEGAAELRVTVSLDGDPATVDVATDNSGVSAQFVVDIVPERWSVLFLDKRPTWMSTFVRRALSDLPRFSVGSRVVAARDVNLDVGSVSALGDAEVLDEYDALVVGAPDALEQREVAMLEGFLRRRGGSVVLLYDQVGDGPHTTLSGVASWKSAVSDVPIDVVRFYGDTTQLRATEFLWPEELPPGAERLTQITSAVPPIDSTAPIVWGTPVGAGYLVVSGALDSWRFRAGDSAHFDDFWRAQIAEAASRAPAPISVEVKEGVAAPGEQNSAVVVLRGLSLPATPGATREAQVKVNMTIESADRSDGLREDASLLPTETLGVFRGDFRSPLVPGLYKVTVLANGYRGAAPLVVTGAPARVGVDGEDMLRLWSEAREGAVFAEDELDQLETSLKSLSRPGEGVTTWFPMRSAWWLLLLAALLGYEWFLRRRDGLA